MAGKELRETLRDKRTLAVMVLFPLVIYPLVSLGTQATLTAADTPDTRSWETLPARIALGRVRVASGHHVVAMSANGAGRTKSVTLAPGGFSVTALTVLH